MKLRCFGCLIALALLAGCSGDEPEDTKATASTSASPSVAGTASPSPVVQAPAARSVDTGPFLRPGTEKVAVVYGDMNGVAPEEIVLHSRSTQPGENGLAAQEYVDAFSWNPGQAKWAKVFDATTFKDLPNGGEEPVLVTDGSVSQAVFGPFEMVDFAGDKAPELVLRSRARGRPPGR